MIGALAIAAWSIVHGFAMLELDGRLNNLPVGTSQFAATVVKFLQFPKAK